MNLPNDKNILLSYINTKLRDNYDSLDSLVSDLDIDKDELINSLAEIDYYYDEKLNKFC